MQKKDIQNLLAVYEEEYQNGLTAEQYSEQFFLGITVSREMLM